VLVERVVALLHDKYASIVQEHNGVREQVVFVMPKELR